MLKSGAVSVLLFLLLCCEIARAEDREFRDYRAGEICRSITASLNGVDGMCRIDAKVYQAGEEGMFCCLIVTDSRGRVIWKSHEKADPADPFFFGGLIYGDSLPQIAGDINGDGKAELIAPAPVSDVRPVTFRVFSWDGKAFHPLFSKTLPAQSGSRDSYRWTAPGQMTGRWIHAFDRLTGKGRAEVEIWECRDGSSKVPKGTAAVEAEAGGFKIVKWLKPLE